METLVINTYTEEELIAIEAKYDELLALSNAKNEEDKKNIRMAFELALEAHKQQRRKSGEPYIFHPIEVARICVEEIELGPLLPLVPYCTMWWRILRLGWQNSKPNLGLRLE